jgi:hypothetical protein
MMTTSYIFRNKGVIDARSITTFGVSSKEGANPIGFFGTGLKYAIAVLLRLKCEITIYSGADKYEFTTEKTRIRVDDFDLVHMNGVPCGFTTELGKTWEVWQAFRELACNTLDEGGEYFSKSSDEGNPWPTDDLQTEVQVTGAAFADAWADRDRILLKPDHVPVYTHEKVDVYVGRSDWMYYRGVRVQKLEKPSLYTYNLKEKLMLTEDRTLKYSFYPTLYIESMYKDCTDAALVRAAVLASEFTFEGSIQYTGSCGEVFREVVTERLKAFDPALNRYAASMIRKGNAGQFITDDTPYLDAVDKKRLSAAITFCNKIGFPVDQYPIVVSNGMGDNLLGLAEQGTIYISKRCFLQGTKMVAGTLIEEYLHLKHGIVDETRQMQNFLIDTICSLGERITKKLL